MASLFFLMAFSSIVICAPLIKVCFGVDAESIDLFNRFQPSSFDHLLGTDELGRDLLIRLIYGGRISLFVGISAALVSAFIGTIIGLMSGYIGGFWDTFLMRLTDSVMSLPILPLLIIFASVDLAKIDYLNLSFDNQYINVWRLILIISLVGWTTVARLVRAKTMVLREADFVKAAKGLGASRKRIIFTHILPNLASPIIVATTLSAGNIT